MRNIDGSVVPVPDSTGAMHPAGISYDPLTTNTYRVAAGYTYSANRLLMSLTTSWQRRTFEQPSFPGSQVFDQSQRDGNIAMVTARFGYRIAGPLTAFTQVSYNDRSYRDASFNSEGWRFEGGIASDLFRLLQGEILGGVMHQTFSGGVGSISTGVFGANLRWYPMPRATVTLYARRDIGEPSAVGQRPGVQTILGGQADLELWHSVLFTGQLMRSRTSFDQGIQGRLTAIEAGPTWLINRNMRLSATWRHTDGSTSLGGGGYVRNVAMLRLRVGF